MAHTFNPSTLWTGRWISVSSRPPIAIQSDPVSKPTNQTNKTKHQSCGVVVVHAFNPTQISEFKASLVYRVSSRTSRTTQRNPVSKNKNKNNTNKKFRFHSTDYCFQCCGTKLLQSAETVYLQYSSWILSHPNEIRIDP